MESSEQRNGLVNLIVLLLAGATGFFAARYADSAAGQMAAVFLGLGLLAAAVSYFQMRLEAREAIEKLEFDEMAKSAASSALFSQEADTFPARRAREQFEKFFVPGFTILLFLIEALGAFFLWRWLAGGIAAPLKQPMVALSILGITALVLFLVGKYSAGMVRLENRRLLSPSASYLLLGAYLYALVAVTVVVVWLAELPRIDLYAARAFCILLMLLAAESLVTLVLEVYRPRLKGKSARLLYESRLVGLLGHPEGLITTAAQALDYQFGFKVSETWFYRFMEKAIAWLLLAQAGILVLSTCFVFIEAGEQALLERFGKPVGGREVLAPGFHFKFPWPIDKLHRYSTREIQQFHVGLEHAEEEGESETLLWTVSHYQDEFLLLVASRDSQVSTNDATGKKRPPVNLLSASIPVQFQIRDLKSWAYNYTDAAELLHQMATREVVRYLASADMLEVISSGRFAAGAALRDRIQRRADQLELGVQIIFVGMQDIHPPVAVAEAYENVVGARIRRQANILEAQAHKIRTNALAEAEAVRRKRRAQAERQRMEVSSLAQAAQFTNQLPAYLASPSVYAQRAYLETLAQGAAGARKIVMAATNTQDVVLLNLEEKLRPDLLSVPLPSVEGR